MNELFGQLIKRREDLTDDSGRWAFIFTKPLIFVHCFRNARANRVGKGYRTFKAFFEESLGTRVFIGEMVIF